MVGARAPDRKSIAGGKGDRWKAAGPGVDHPAVLGLGGGPSPPDEGPRPWDCAKES